VNSQINKKTNVIDLGLTDYKKAWDFQEALFKKSVDIKISNRSKPAAMQAVTPNYLVFCQHPHVYTLGKSGEQENLLVKEHDLKSIQATYYKINRGGDITYHGPGQIVCYPILDLDNFFTDIHKYLRYLEEAVILTCKDYGLVTGRIEDLTGVWVDADKKINPRKICALGVKTSRWVTMHGLAFNISTDLTYFGNIVPCGINDKSVTSLSKELGREIPLAEAQEKLKTNIARVFNMILE